MKQWLFTLYVSPQAHSSYLHGRATDAAEIFAGIREQFSPYAVHKKRKTEFFCIVHACLVSITVVYLGACFSGINIYSKILDFASYAFFHASSSGCHLQ